MKIPKGWQLVPSAPTDEMCDAYASMSTAGGLKAYNKNVVHAYYKTMLEAAPTPPAQEDEPYAYAYEYVAENSTAEVRELIGVAFRKKRLDNVLPDHKEILLYTRPDNDGLRKAAEEVMNIIHEDNVYSIPLPRRLWDALNDLNILLHT